MSTLRTEATEGNGRATVSGGALLLPFCVFAFSISGAFAGAAMASDGPPVAVQHLAIAEPATALAGAMHAKTRGFEAKIPSH